jgi:hypothetical protein
MTPAEKARQEIDRQLEACGCSLTLRSQQNNRRRGWDGMMGNQDDQLELFPPDNDDSPGSPCRWQRPAPQSITPGDWLSIEHEGKTVVGMIYRRQDETYTFVYWDDCILRFGTTTRDRIGPWDEELTDQFRGQIAVFPHYVEKCIAAWVMQPEQPVRTRPDMTRWESMRDEPPRVQQRLFPE